MLFFIAIFSCAWIFILMQLIDHTFIFKKRIKNQIISFTFMASSLFLSFLFSIISFYLLLNFLNKLPIYLGIEQKKQAVNIIIPQADCLLMQNAIKQTESKIGKSENHRYIEDTAHLFTIKIEYQKAAQKLKEQAKIYNNLELSPQAQNYSRQIGEKLQEQSELFSQRTAIRTNREGIKKIYKLLKKMDKIDRKRLRLIDRVKQQCNNTA